MNHLVEIQRLHLPSARKCKHNQTQEKPNGGSHLNQLYVNHLEPIVRFNYHIKS
jgi:hypothetical protein